MKFSIITSMYNSYNKMGKYLKSLERQTYKNFEVIIVDDGSTDNSYFEIKNYINKSDLNFKIIRQNKNTGPGIARNIGLENISGDYLLFIDSDDYIEDNFFYQINNVLEKKRVDCLIIDFYREINSRKILNSSIPGSVEGYINKNLALALSTGSVCCKIYKSELIKKNNVMFPGLMRYEDMVFNKRALTYCDSILYYKKPLYNYVYNKDSIVNNNAYKKINFAFQAFDLLEKELKENFPEELEAIFIRELLYSSVLMLSSKGYDNKKIKNFIKDLEKKYPKWVENKYIKKFSLHHKIALKFIHYRFVLGMKLLDHLKKYVFK